MEEKNINIWWGLWMKVVQKIVFSEPMALQICQTTTPILSYHWPCWWRLLKVVVQEAHFTSHTAQDLSDALDYNSHYLYIPKLWGIGLGKAVFKCFDILCIFVTLSASKTLQT